MREVKEGLAIRYLFDDGFDDLKGRGRRSKVFSCSTCRKPGVFEKIGEIIREWERPAWTEDQADDDDYDPDEMEDCWETEMFYYCPHCDKEWTDTDSECESR